MMTERSELDKELARLKGMSDENKREFDHKLSRDKQLQSKLVSSCFVFINDVIINF